MKPNGTFEADLRISSTWRYVVDGMSYDTGVAIADAQTEQHELIKWALTNVETASFTLPLVATETPQSELVDETDAVAVAIDETRDAAARCQCLVQALKESLEAKELETRALHATCEAQGRKLARIAGCYSNLLFSETFPNPQTVLEVIRQILVEKKS